MRLNHSFNQFDFHWMSIISKLPLKYWFETLYLNQVCCYVRVWFSANSIPKERFWQNLIFKSLFVSWLHEIDQNCDVVNRVLVGNKCDDPERKVVLTEDARRFADQVEVDYNKTFYPAKNLFQNLSTSKTSAHFTRYCRSYCT